jgi:hypothetical protein
MGYRYDNHALTMKHVGLSMLLLWIAITIRICYLKTYYFSRSHAHMQDVNKIVSSGSKIKCIDL